jgi:hypothetical protein
MLRRLLILSPAVCVVAVLSGCASSVYEGKYAWDDGWREAKVLRIAAGSELGGRHTHDCRYKKSAVPSQRYAEVAVRMAGKDRRAVVPVADDTRLATGDAVYANVRECTASTIVPRQG